MSQESTRQYQLQRERELREQQRREHEKRVRADIATYLERFKNTLDSLRAQGLDAYAKEEFTNIQAQMQRITDLSVNDPFGARELNMQLGHQAHALPQLCQTRQREHIEEQRRLEELERQRQIAEQKAQEAQRRAHLQALSRAWEEALQSWKNKSARNLALEELSALHANIFADPQDYTLQDLQAQVLDLETKFTATLQAQQAKEQKELEEKYKQELLERYKAELPDHAKLLGLAELQEEIKKIEQARAKRAEDEAVRKEMVKAVYSALQQAGFRVQAPSLDPDKDLVIVRAGRPNGSQAHFKISLDGALNYRFDHYEGKTCKADINQVLPKLSEVYGVDLSQERVIWENPDDLDKEARPLNPDQTQNRS